MKGRILILDDELCYRHCLRMMLETAGHECAEAGDDREAFEILQTQAFDLVIQDMARPPKWEVQGCEFVRGLRADPRLQQTPVLIVSADSEDEAAAFFEKSGLSFIEHIAGYLRKEKGLTREKLTAKVEAILLWHDQSARTMREFKRFSQENPFLSDTANRLERQLLDLLKTKTALFIPKVNLLRHHLRDRLLPVTRLLHSLSEVGEEREFALRVCQARRAVESIEKLVGGAAPCLIPFSVPELSVNESIALLVDELECRYAATDTTVQSRVSKDLANLTITDPCGPWGLMIVAMSGIDLPAQMVRRYCDHGWIHLLCHPLELPPGATLTVEADVSGEDGNRIIELRVRTASAVLGKCWFKVDSICPRGT